MMMGHEGRDHPPPALTYNSISGRLLRPQGRVGYQLVTCPSPPNPQTKLPLSDVSIGFCPRCPPVDIGPNIEKSFVSC